MATKTNTEINGKSYYRIKRVVGYEYINGEKKSITKQFYGRSKSEAESKYRSYKDDMIRQEYERQESLQAASNRTVGELMKYYACNVLEDDSKYAPGTRRLYINSYKRHLSDSNLMSAKISDISSEDIQSYYKDLRITKAALKTLHNFMSAFFKWADGKYCTNVLSTVVLPEKPENKMSDDIVIWSDSELEKIKERLSDHPYYPCIVLSLYAGLRISEVLGLKWSDIYDETIHIKRQYYRGSIKDPKAKSFRNIPLHPAIKDVLSTMDHKYEYIFTTESGRLIDYNNFEHRMARAYRNAGIEHKKFHAYRATFITNLCRSGVRLEVASKLAGHSSVSVTAKYYTFISDKEKSEAINSLK